MGPSVRLMRRRGTQNVSASATAVSGTGRRRAYRLRDVSTATAGGGIGLDMMPFVGAFSRLDRIISLAPFGMP